MTKRLLETFNTLHQAKTGGIRYASVRGKDWKILESLQEHYSDDDIERFMRGFFEIQDPFIEQAGYSIGVFRATLPKVIVWLTQDQRPHYDKATAGIARWLENHKRRQSGN